MNENLSFLTKAVVDGFCGFSSIYSFFKFFLYLSYSIMPLKLVNETVLNVSSVFKDLNPALFAPVF